MKKLLTVLLVILAILCFQFVYKDILKIPVSNQKLNAIAALKEGNVAVLRGDIIREEQNPDLPSSYKQYVVRQWDTENEVSVIAPVGSNMVGQVTVYDKKNNRYDARPFEGARNDDLNITIIKNLGPRWLGGYFVKKYKISTDLYIKTPRTYAIGLKRLESGKTYGAHGLKYEDDNELIIYSVEEPLQYVLD